MKELAFVPCDPEPEQAAETPVSCNPEKIILLNGSLRGEEANTRKFLGKLSESLVKGEIVNLSAARTDETVRTLLSAGTLVLGMPMYVDGIPSQVLRVMERLERNPGDRKRIYVVANMGLYESRQLRHLLSMVRDWSEKCGYDYCGGIAIGAGEMMKMFMTGKGPARNVAEGISRLAAAINTYGKTEDIYADANGFPRWMYIFAANMGWPKGGRKNGLKKKDLLRRRGDREQR